MIDANCRKRCGPIPEAEDETQYSAGYPNHPELAIVALIQLLSRYPATRKPAVAHAILDHLRIIGDDARLVPVLRECAQALVDDWQGYAVLSGDAPPSSSRPYC